MHRKCMKILKNLIFFILFNLWLISIDFEGSIRFLHLLMMIFKTK